MDDVLRSRWRIMSFLRDNPSDVSRIQSTAFTFVRFALGSLLLSAAMLKGHELLTSPQFKLNSFEWLPAIAIPVEFTLGLAFLVGVQLSLVRSASIVTFAAFTAYSLFLVSRGDRSCGCFGKITVDPWWTSLIDVCALAALCVCRPIKNADDAVHRGNNSSGPNYWAVLAHSSFLVVGLGLGWSAAVLATSARARSHSLTANNDAVVLEPKDWIGKPFPLTDQIDVGDRLVNGMWQVLIYQHECPRCQKAIEQIRASSRKSTVSELQPDIALIEMPPYSKTARDSTPFDGGLIYGRLNPSQKWLGETPIKITLVQGIVVNFLD